MAGTYITPCTPTPTAEMLMKAETCIRVGSGRLFTSLEVASWTYLTYGISIGLQAGQNFRLGLIAELTFSHVPSYEPLENVNLSDDPLFEVTGEETLINVTIREFNVNVIELALGTGTRYDLANETVFSYGGGCTMLRRPYSLEFINESCYAPSTQNINLGVQGGAITVYDAFIQSGLEWAMSAKEGNTVPLEIQALPVTSNARGNRLGSVYFY